jgi:hypothetical protein
VVGGIAGALGGGYAGHKIEQHFHVSVPDSREGTSKIVDALEPKMREAQRAAMEQQVREAQAARLRL